MRRRLGQIGLGGRLALAVGTMMVLTVALAFAVVYHQAGLVVRSQIDRTIQGAAIQMTRALADDRDPSGEGTLLVARTYLAGQPYGNSPALLFYIAPGVGFASNQPELFGAGSGDDGEAAGKQAQENAAGSALRTPHVGFTTQQAPDIGRLRVYEQRVHLRSYTGYVGAAEPLSAVDTARHGVAGSFALAGGLALAIAVLAAYLIGARMSQPVRRAAGVAAQIDAGDLTPRMEMEEGAIRELQVLGDAFNHMLDRLERGFAAQREFVADASHELRTPLTVVRGQLELLAQDESISHADVQRTERIIQAEVARLSRMVDEMLLLAQTGQADFLHLETIYLPDFINDLWDGLSLTAERDFVVGEVAAIEVRVDPDRLAQALRNLARNAIAHTSGPDGLVRIDVTQPGVNVVRLAVSDDGPGIPAAARERVFERFYRLDPARTRAEGGAGLGLSIVLAIVEAHGGRVRATDAQPHGARVEIDLPLR